MELGVRAEAVRRPRRAWDGAGRASRGRSTAEASLGWSWACEPRPFDGRGEPGMELGVRAEAVRRPRRAWDGAGRASRGRSTAEASLGWSWACWPRPKGRLPLMSDKPPLLVIAGPTGVGKTAAAVALAARLPIEVVSADSRQVYRGMDVATGKPTADELRAVRHHLVDVVDPDDRYDAARFARDARAKHTGR